MHNWFVYKNKNVLAIVVVGNEQWELSFLGEWACVAEVDLEWIEFLDIWGYSYEDGFGE